MEPSGDDDPRERLGYWDVFSDGSFGREDCYKSWSLTVPLLCWKKDLLNADVPHPDQTSNQQAIPALIETSRT